MRDDRKKQIEKLASLAMDQFADEIESFERDEEETWRILLDEAIYRYANAVAQSRSSSEYAE